MTNTAPALFRSVIIYAICLPLAILLGYLLAPDAANFYEWFNASGKTVLLMLFLLTLPLLLRWHHAWLIASWNMSVVLFFLPGAPSLWLLMSILSLTIAVGQYILNRKIQFLQAPSVTRSLIFLISVVFVTALMTGGFGLRIAGSENFGGKRYIFILCAAFGYFALTSQQIPPRRAERYIMLFFLGQVTMAIGELVQWFNPAFYFIFNIFPPTARGVQAVVDTAAGPIDQVARFSGLAPACSGLFYAMMARYGIREIFNLGRFWRVIVFLAAVCLSMLGGFRTYLILFILTFTILFYLEGLMRSRFLPFIILSLLLGGAVLVPMANRLPLSVQRTLSFLPIRIDPVARLDAQTSVDWRIHIWTQLIPQIPRYLLVGKGYGIKAGDFAAISASSGTLNDEASAELVGDYHNGPLSVIIPFGILGSMGFLWFLWAGLRVLQRNYQHGDPDYRRLNAFLLAYFVTRVLFFVVGFGSLYSDMAVFTGLIGLSVSLNGGVCQAAIPSETEAAQGRVALSSAS